MPSKEIIIEIDESGNCSLDGKGFVGPECEKAMSEIESALGRTTNKVHKPEYSIINRTNTRNKERA
jgi:hypothetical protein